MNFFLPLLLVGRMAFAGPGAPTPPAPDENTYNADRGLHLSATVLSEMDITVEPVAERRVSITESAHGRVVSAGTRPLVFAVVPAGTGGAWRPGSAAIVDGLPGRVRSLRAGEVVIDVDDPRRRLSAGAFVPVRSAAVALRGLFLPEGSLVDRGSELFAYVRNEAYLKRVPVKAGRRGGGWVEIVDGLLPGDEVATGDVAALWIAELRAVTAGGRCCPL